MLAFWNFSCTVLDMETLHLKKLVLAAVAKSAASRFASLGDHGASSALELLAANIAHVSFREATHMLRLFLAR
jgi:hypothetical protein